MLEAAKQILDQQEVTITKSEQRLRRNQVKPQNTLDLIPPNKQPLKGPMLLQKRNVHTNVRVYYILYLIFRLGRNSSNSHPL